jgi:hypothetical protein
MAAVGQPGARPSSLAAASSNAGTSERLAASLALSSSTTRLLGCNAGLIVQPLGLVVGSLAVDRFGV